jgi:nucleoid DNA-binding protein
MNKKKLIEEIVRQTNLSNADVTHVMDAALNIINETLRKGDSVTLEGLGTFALQKEKSKIERNQRTGFVFKPQTTKSTRINSYLKAGTVVKAQITKNSSGSNLRKGTILTGTVVTTASRAKRTFLLNCAVGTGTDVPGPSISLAYGTGTDVPGPGITLKLKERQ